MKIGVKINTGQAVKYKDSLSLYQLAKKGIRPATEHEKEIYYRLLPLFKTKRLKKINLVNY